MIVEYNDRCKRLCVNPVDKDNTMSIFTKGNMIFVLISIVMSVLPGWSISVHASEKLPFDVDWACNLIMESVAGGHRTDELSQEIVKLSEMQNDAIEKYNEQVRAREGIFKFTILLI